MCSYQLWSITKARLANHLIFGIEGDFTFNEGDQIDHTLVVSGLNYPRGVNLG